MNENTITITLTDARPIRVSNRTWPLVAKATRATDHNNQDLTRRHYLKVRQQAMQIPDGVADAMEYYGSSKAEYTLAPHPDDRLVVYGWSESSYQSEHGSEAGFVCSLDEAAEMIRRVGEIIGADKTLISDCCGDLPPIDMSGDQSWIDALTLEQLEFAIGKKRDSAAQAQDSKTDGSSASR